jgi:alpha-tubulin suppressor-like RCC1 family protein
VAGETAIVDATPTCQEPAVRALAAGFHGFACVVRCAGDVWCWGRNDRGQLGAGDTTPSDTPRAVVDASGAPSAPVTIPFAPSLAADGSAVAFVCNTPLLPSDTNTQPDVYLRVFR